MTNHLSYVETAQHLQAETEKNSKNGLQFLPHTYIFYASHERVN